MCGRYATTLSGEELGNTFDIQTSVSDLFLPADYNMAPTKLAPVVLARPPRDEPGAEPVRQLRLLRWGLIPSWAKGPSIGSRMINARAETVATKPAFRRAFAARRALVPAAGFYEWFPTQQLNRAGKPLKQPFFLHPKDGGTLAFAGIYEFWRDDTRPAEGDDAWLVTYAIITTTATDDIGHLHDRMPMTVTPDNWTNWLDPRTKPDHAFALMASPPAGSLHAYAVTTAVNNVRNNGPELLDALPTTSD